MKRKYFLNKAFLFNCLIISLLFVSCTDGFDRLNTNPFVKPSVPGSESNGAGIDLCETTNDAEIASLNSTKESVGAVFKNFTYEGLVNDYQRATNLTHDIYAGYFATNKPDFLTSSPNYIYTDGWSALRWDHFYKDRSYEYKVLARTFWYLDRKAYKNAFYITRIYYAFLTSTMTDTYGDMPLGNYVRAESAPDKVSYNTQKDIYDMIFRMLKQATDSIVPGNSSFKFKETDDKCFKGDESKWLRFANTLRLRLALRISNIDPVRAQREAESAMAHPAGLMSSQEDKMATVPNYAPVALGGENQGGNENEVVNCSFRYVDAVMSKDLELAYKDQSNVLDPRCSISWFRPTPMELLVRGKELKDKDFTGCEIGSNNINHNSDLYSVIRCNAWEDKSKLRDDYWFGYSREYLWLSYAESRFLLAEASLRGWKGATKTPRGYFEDGIRASMDYYHIPSQFTEQYIKGLKIYSTDSDPFILNNKEGMLEQIITQKWLAVFPNGNEAWAEFRRTDYPRLRNHLNNRDSNIPGKMFINRLRYPNSEIDYNADNIPAGINQSTLLWWDVANTNIPSGERNKPNNFR